MNPHTVIVACTAFVTEQTQGEAEFLDLPAGRQADLLRAMTAALHAAVHADRGDGPLPPEVDVDIADPWLTTTEETA